MGHREGGISALSAGGGIKPGTVNGVFGLTIPLPALKQSIVMVALHGGRGGLTRVVMAAVFVGVFVFVDSGEVIWSTTVPA